MDDMQLVDLAEVNVTIDQLMYLAYEANKSVEVCVTLNGPLQRAVAVMLFTDPGVNTTVEGSGDRVNGRGDELGSGEELGSVVKAEDGNMSISQTTALPDVDYQSLRSLLVFTTQGTQCDIVELIEDLTLEDEEVFKISIESVITILLPSAHIVLRDSDSELVISEYVLSNYLPLSLVVELALSISQDEVVEGNAVEIPVLVTNNITIERDFAITLSILSDGMLLRENTEGSEPLSQNNLLCDETDWNVLCHIPVIKQRTPGDCQKSLHASIGSAEV